MNRLLVFNEFAKYVQSDSEYYSRGRPSQVGVIEDLLAFFGLTYNIQAGTLFMHIDGLNKLKTYLLEQASEDQLKLVHDIVTVGRSIPNMNPVCDSAGKVFVSMPMNPEKYDCVDVIRDGMRRGIEATKNTPYFLDLDLHFGSIPDKMLDEIRSCKFLVADLTKQITGVYYEAGYAAALGKTVIHTCRTDDLCNLHFDISYIQALVWTDADDLSNKLADAIRRKGLC